jgi:NifU-like protein involved in Fe-S cluster formation
MPATAVLSRAAEARLRQPLRRGTFRPRDAARRRLGLLTVADGDGQARIYWLVDLASQRIEDSRFLAFGELTSHPVADAFCEEVRQRTVAEACALPAGAVELVLRDDPGVPAFGDAGLAPLAFLADLQARALAALPAVELLPAPVEKIVYQRKREADWDATDRSWLPLSLLRKVGKADAVIAKALAEHAPGASHRIDGLHDDFRVVLRLDGVVADQAPTLGLFLASALRQIHPGITVEVAS